jgi:Protein of unknown function (DUF2971)
MLVYHFLPAKYALDDLARKRLKISELDDLNDPFELWCIAQENRRLRQALREWKKELAQQFGVLCFSVGWTNPVLWSHYADKHRGICLGFEVDERRIKPIQYVSERAEFQFPPTEDSVGQLLFTKFRDWSYEEEMRGWFKLDERDNQTGHFFYPFDDAVRLREVIAGSLCELPKAAITEALGGNVGEVEIIKARLAFRTFKVVTQHRGFPL